MPINDKILVSDYNNIRNKVVSVLGSGNGPFGYGQPISSLSVSESSRITVNEYAQLRNDIINAYRHIFGGAADIPPQPALVSPSVGAKVKYNDSGTTPEDATEPIVQYDRYADQIVENRFTVDPSQVICVLKGTQSKSDWVQGYWNTRLSCTITINFSDSNQARYFFNSGGEIRFASSRTEGEEFRQQNVAWSSLLNSAATLDLCNQSSGVHFGAQKPDGGFSPMNGRNFYRLTNFYQTWFTTSASTPYSDNTYRIQVRSNVANNSSGTANQLDFLVEWIDGYKDLGPNDPGINPIPGDEVDGRISISVSTLEARGVLVPISTGNFTVESPTVSFGPIIQDPNGPLVGF